MNILCLWLVVFVTHNCQNSHKNSNFLERFCINYKLSSSALGVLLLVAIHCLSLPHKAVKMVLVVVIFMTGI